MLKELCFQQCKAKTERCDTYASLNESLEGSPIGDILTGRPVTTCVTGSFGWRKEKKAKIYIYTKVSETFSTLGRHAVWSVDLSA
jgi:hypothetical protein